MLSRQIIAACLMLPFAATSSPMAADTGQPKSDWWKSAVFYQVYPRSFKDTDGDGLGDFKGLTEKLDYLKDLGVDAIWINPHYASPNTDNGYDISDYRRVMKEYGTMEDFDRLMTELKKRDMRLMVDIVINHSSDQHEWFRQSRTAKDNPYRDYYIWRDGKDGRPPNNYPSFFGGSAWEKDPATDQYYLHYFARQQPDLNWDNPKLREELYAMLRFWLDKGVSGMRFDTVATYAKVPGFPDLTPQEMKNFAEAYTKGPNLHPYIQEMHEKVFSQYDAVAAGEIFGAPLDQVPLFVDSRRKELDMAFTFDLIRYDRAVDRWHTVPRSLADFRQTIGKLDATVGEHGWTTFFLGNHDNPRAVSHFGDDRPQWRALSAKALATLLLTQRGTPFIFQGDELGMTNYPFKSLEDFDDIEVKGFVQDYVDTGKATREELLANVAIISRDNARTPFQWDDSANAGFTTGKPWLKINPNYTEINAHQEVADPTSVYAFYRDVIAIRHKTPALSTGAYRDLDPQDKEVYAFTRSQDGETYLVVVNFKEAARPFALPGGMKIVETLVESGSAGKPESGAASLALQPWQSGIYKVQ